MRNVRYGFMYLNTWAPVDCAVWEGYGMFRSLAGGNVLLGQPLRVCSLAHFLFSISASCVRMKCELSTPTWEWNMTSLPPHSQTGIKLRTPCLPHHDGCHPTWTVRQNTLFLLWLAIFQIILFIYLFLSQQQKANQSRHLYFSFVHDYRCGVSFLGFPFSAPLWILSLSPRVTNFPIAPLSRASPPLAWVPVSGVFFCTYMLLNTLFYISDKQYPTTLPSYSADLNTCCTWEPIKKLLKTCQAQVHLKVLN